jgi:hypothetical protein
VIATQSWSKRAVAKMSSDAQSDDDYAWVNYFCSLKGNEFFCQVDEDYMHDGFNLVGLNTQVPYYDFALDVVLDVDFDGELGYRGVVFELTLFDSLIFKIPI